VPCRTHLERAEQLGAAEERWATGQMQGQVAADRGGAQAPCRPGSRSWIGLRASRAQSSRTSSRPCTSGVSPRAASAPRRDTACGAWVHQGLNRCAKAIVRSSPLPCALRTHVEPTTASTPVVYADTGGGVKELAGIMIKAGPSTV